MIFPTLLTLLTLLSSTLAIQVTSPLATTLWASGTASQTVTWVSVATDPTTFAMVLVNQNANFLPTSPTTLNANVTTSLGSLTVTFPSGTWPVGTGFQVNLVNSLTQTTSILAQSAMFNITSSGTVSTPTTIAGASTAITGAATSASSTGSAVYSGNAGTGSIPTATSKSAAGKIAPISFPIGTSASAGLALVGVLAGMMVL